MSETTPAQGSLVRTLLSLYWLFFKVGATTFGGGYSMLPILLREVVQARRWNTEEEVMDYYALSQGLPGIIAINVSAFIGYSRRGKAGAVVAALGTVTPSIIIIALIAACLSNFQDNPYVRRALAGVSVCVAALILDAVLGLWKKGVKDVWGVLLCLAMFALTEFTSISPILLILAAALVGIGISAISRRRGGGGN